MKTKEKRIRKVGEVTRRKPLADVAVSPEIINLATKIVEEHKLLPAPKETLVKTGCLEENICLLTDSYKEGHWLMLPEKTETVYSYFESRNGAKYPYTVFFGLQMILKKWFTGIVVTQDDIEKADAFCKEHFGMDIFNRKMWEKIVNVYGGKLPLKIKAVPEGLAVPINNVMMSVENTDPDCAPLTNIVESIISQIWHASNVATISRDLRVYMERALEVSANSKDLLPFLLHDFGLRGISGVEPAGMGGAGHLVNFFGTDTIPAIVYAQRYYNAKMVGFSVPASEHSVMTALGEDGELETFRNLIKKFPNGILSIVSDSYNIVRVLEAYLPKLKDEILARNGKVVIRPDSPRHKGDTAAAQVLWIVNELEKIFGYTFNKKGYKVLNPKIGVIIGDGLKPEDIKETIKTLVLAGYSADTCVFGMGGGLLQSHTRDLQRNAFKCSAQKRDGKWYDVYKKPLDLTKSSKAGRLKLVWDNNTLITVPTDDQREDVLQVVFENGNLIKDYTFDEIRENAKKKILN